MAALVPCLVRLRSEVNELAPDRDKSSDGWIGDTAHSKTKSDHNPDARGFVHAIDLDKDLRKPGWSMDRIVQILVTRHRSGLDDRLQYVIWKGRIWSRSWGWTARTYTGPNPHDEHAHASARHVVALENNTRPWGLLAATQPTPAKPAPATEDDMPLSTDDLTKLRALVREEITASIPKFWGADIDPGPATQTAYGALFTNLARTGALANTLVPGLISAVAEVAEGQVDPEQLAAAVVAKLPASGDVTAAELKDAIVAAARDLLT